MDIMFSVRPLDENEGTFVNESIFDTLNLIEALRKVEQQYCETQTRCIIVSLPEK